MEQSSLATWAALTATASADAQETGRALMLWLILAVGLGVFLVGIVLISLSRRIRAARKAVEPSAEIDAWQAAADRISTPRPPDTPD